MEYRLSAVMFRNGGFQISQNCGADDWILTGWQWC